MSRSPSPTPPKGSVRSIISIFENQSFPVGDEPTNLIRRTKSLGSLNQPPRVVPKRVEPAKSLELSQIEQQIRHLQNNLSRNYRTYSRDNHVYYQNQIIFVFTDLANLEAGNSEAKAELTESLKKLNKKLNALLPSHTAKRVARAKVKREVAPPPREVASPPREEAVEDEVDAPAVSVRTLKEMFEKNTNENEAKREFGSAKVTRKFLTFNGTSDVKYVPFSQKYKSGLDAEFHSEGSYSFITRRNELSVSDDENYEDKEENMSPDSLSERSSSGEGSDGEQEDRDQAKEEH